MLGFDYELRRRGFAGNSCQIVLGLKTAVAASLLEQRIADLVRLHPILASKPLRGFRPRWEPTGKKVQVRIHANAPNLMQSLFNERLDIHQGELIRFDLVGQSLVFTWAHALMDAKSAEYFLAMVGDVNVPVPETGKDWYAERGTRAGSLRARGKQAWLELHRLEKFKTALPVSLGTLRPPKSPTLIYKVVALSREDTVCARANASRLCGFLGDTSFHLAVTLVELHELQSRTERPSASYVVPIPVSLRPKGSRAPLFSNQVTMMLHQFLPAEVSTVERAVAAVKTQQNDFFRDNQIDAGITLAHFFRRLPMWFYMRMIKHELRGEICSLFFGDTAAVDSALRHFMGAAIETFAHVPAVTLPPGIGVVFHRVREQLQFTLVYAEGVLTSAEADTFSNRLRDRLLNP